MMDFMWLGVFLIGAALGFWISTLRQARFLVVRIPHRKGPASSSLLAVSVKQLLETEKVVLITLSIGFSWNPMLLTLVSSKPVAGKALSGGIKKNKDPLEIEKLADLRKKFKMVLVARNDLKMGKGKIAAQCSHATLGLYKKILQRAPKALNRWEYCGQAKVVVKVESEEEMLTLQERAKSLKLPTHITIDAGKTQIAPDSRTVMAILGPVDVVDDVTGGLKLM